MGKPTGFLEFRREGAKQRDPRERLADWNELYVLPDEDSLRRQGARCMDCGVAFCHTGTMLAGAATGCPLHNLVPEWNDLVYRGQWREAARRLEHTNDFPEFTGRVCPAPCEGSCVLGIHDDPVAIKSIERAIADRALMEGWVVAETPAARTGKFVAVVGSGPAGLACASQLNRAGHRVTVFERADRPGGLLTYGIPNMKLDKSLVEHRVRLLAEAGVQFTTGVEIGRTVPTSTLEEHYDATVLAVGSTRARDLPVEGRDLAGVHLALAYLTAATRHVLDEQAPGTLDARGRRVVVIGGGDTGADCVATALRQQAASVTQFEILPHPPAARGADNPWPQWPRVHRTDYAHEEALALNGSDPREFGVSTTRLVGGADGRVREVHTVRVEWTRTADGRHVPRGIAGTERVYGADLVLLALGFTGPQREGLLADLDVRMDERGNVWTDETRMTSVPGVFAAGDAVRGQSLVVWAIHEGRRVAQSVDRWLMFGESDLSG